MKTGNIRLVLAAFSVLLALSSAQAQGKKQSVPEATLNLMKFVGRWNADATLTMNGKSYKVDYNVNCRKTADGSGLYFDEWFSNPELGNMKGSDLAGYSADDKKIHWFFVDNMGAAYAYTGSWGNPNHLTIEYDGTKDGKPYMEKVDFVFTGKDELKYSSVSTLDGKPSDTGEGIFHRKVPSATKK